MPKSLTTLLVALPALNEEMTVADVIARIPRSIPGVDHVRVLVIDDGSTDKTAELARAAGARVISHDGRRGVGAAFHTMVEYALSRPVTMMVTIDADGQFNPADIPQLARTVIDNEADFATASRFKDPALLPSMSRVKLWGNHRMSWLISQLTGRKFHDVSCGMRCYSRKALMTLNLRGNFTYTQEVFLNLAYKGLRVMEVPIKVRGTREFGKSRMASNIPRYAIQTSRIIFACTRDYRPLLFFGGQAIVCGLLSLALLTFLGVHYAQTGMLSPHKWAGFSSATLLLLSLGLAHVGVIGDMMQRQREYLEELLYRQRFEDQQRSGWEPEDAVAAQDAGESGAWPVARLSPAEEAALLGSDATPEVSTSKTTPSEAGPAEANPSQDSAEADATSEGEAVASLDSTAPGTA